MDALNISLAPQLNPYKRLTFKVDNIWQIKTKIFALGKSFHKPFKEFKFTKHLILFCCDFSQERTWKLQNLLYHSH